MPSQIELDATPTREIYCSIVGGLLAFVNSLIMLLMFGVVGQSKRGWYCRTFALPMLCGAGQAILLSGHVNQARDERGNMI
jgi:hypothetical protein